MTCILCHKKSVIDLQQGALCRECFTRNFQKKVYRSVRKYGLFTKKDSLCFAVSGGRDSMSALCIVKDIAKQQRQKLFVLNVDEGGKGCGKRTEHVESFCRKHDIDLVSVSFRDEFGSTCDDFDKAIKGKKLDVECSAICIALRMKLFAKYAKKLGASKVVLGTNLDDEAKAFVMNLFRKGGHITSGLGPTVEFKGVKFIKPLYMCTSEEATLYANYMKLGVTCDCACSRTGRDAFVDRKLDELEKSYMGTKTAIIRNVLDLLPVLESAKGDSRHRDAMKKLGIKHF